MHVQPHTNLRGTATHPPPQQLPSPTRRDTGLYRQVAHGCDSASYRACRRANRPRLTLLIADHAPIVPGWAKVIAPATATPRERIADDSLKVIVCTAFHAGPS